MLHDRDEKRLEARKGLNNIARDSMLTGELLELQEHRELLQRIIEIVERIDRDLDNGKRGS